MVAAVLAAVWYLRRSRSYGTTGHTPGLLRPGLFALGILAIMAATSSGVEHQVRSSFSVWLAQGLFLMLLVPVPLLLGMPSANPAGTAERATGGGRFAELNRFIGSPVVGAALIPVATVVFFFGPVPAWSLRWTVAAWLIQLALVAAGMVILTPVFGRDRGFSSEVMAGIVALAVVELVIDAVPGIVMRLSTHPVTGFFSYRAPSRVSWLHDQQFAGGVLWCVAELVDLPFLLLIFRRWIQSDARDAAAADIALDAAVDPEGETDEPWFLRDERLKDRYRRS